MLKFVQPPNRVCLKQEQIDLGNQSRQTSRVFTATLTLYTMKGGCVQGKQPLPYRWHIFDVRLEPRNAKSGGFEGHSKALIVEKHPGWLERRGKEESIWYDSPYRGVYMDELAGNEKDPGVVKLEGGGALALLLVKIRSVAEALETANQKKQDQLLDPANMLLLYQSNIGQIH
jgi:hypothetical protein